MLTVKENAFKMQNRYFCFPDIKSSALLTTANYTNIYTNKHYWMFLLMQIVCMSVMH
jgi:hypothetical protein